MHRTFYVLALLGLTHCASITGSSYDHLRVAATPAAATVSVNGESRGVAPQVVDIPRRGRSTVTVRAPGYRPSHCNTAMSPSAGYIAADIALCVIFFPIGCISFIDAGGAWNALESPYCEVALQPES